MCGIWGKRFGASGSSRAPPCMMRAGSGVGCQVQLPSLEQVEAHELVLAKAVVPHGGSNGSGLLG